MALQELQASDYRIRKLVGTLGLSLPILLPVAKQELLASISHYYYDTLSSLLFIIILSAFGLFLLSYKGYKKDRQTEQISDDFLTNIGGLAALVVVAIPTVCKGSMSSSINVLCESKAYPLFGHDNASLNTIHLVSAGIFILCMGWMSKYKFTRGHKPLHNKIYRQCGNVVFGAIGFLIGGSLLQHFEINFLINDYYVFIFESIAIFAFGLSWLIKGEAIENIMAVKDRMLK